MKKQSFFKRFFTPVFIVFCFMTLSWITYNIAWRLDNAELHHLLADISGPILLIAVALGTIFIYPMAYFRGASASERIIASFTNPLIWMTKEFIRMLTAFATPEALYYYINPLHVWLILGTIAQISLMELICRSVAKRRGDVKKGFSLPVFVTLFVSIFLVISLYAWGRGENVFSFYLEMYREIFGPGIGVKPL
jgi:hypothetical protein